MIDYAVGKYLPTVIDALVYSDDATAKPNVFVGYTPATPDVVVVVTATPGLPQPTLSPVDLPSFQIRCRAPKARDAAAMCKAIIGELNCLDRVTLDPGGPDEVYVIGITATQSTPAAIGRDGNQRYEFVANFDARVAAPSTHRPATPGV